MVVLPVYYLCSWCPQRPEEDIESPGTGLTDSCKPTCGYWDLNTALLEEQPVLLTLGPYTQPILFSFVVVFVCFFVCLILEIAWEHVAQCSLKLSDPSALVSWCMPLHPAHFL